MTTDTDIQPEQLIGLPCENVGRLWTIAAYKRGWFTLENADGETKKARIADIDVLEDAEESEVSANMAKQLAKYRNGYVVSLSASGKKSLNCGDILAQMLEGTHYMEVYALAEKWCDLPIGSLEAKYAGLKNDGMRRMNAGNRLRALLRRSEDAEEGTPAYEFAQWLRGQREAGESAGE